MSEAVKVRRRGLFMKHVLAELARRAGASAIGKQAGSCCPVEDE